MKELLRIPMREDTVTLLQYLVYEMDGLKILNCRIIQSGSASNAIYDRYIREYREACCTYHMTFNEVVKEYASEYANSQHQYQTDFLTGELVVFGPVKVEQA